MEALCVSIPVSVSVPVSVAFGKFRAKRPGAAIGDSYLRLLLACHLSFSRRWNGSSLPRLIALKGGGLEFTLNNEIQKIVVECA